MRNPPARLLLPVFFAVVLAACGGGGGGGGGGGTTTPPPPPPPPVNQAPTASIATNQSEGLAPVAIQFDGSGSTDSDGSISAYAWDFGDGATAAGDAVEHTFGPGQFTVTLTVTDDDGATASTTVAVRGLAEPVAVAAVADAAGHAPFAAVFDASQSTDDDDNITTYDWAFGDGATAQGASVNHTYDDVGQYTVSLTVTDADGYTSSTSLMLNVHEQLAGYYRGTLSSDVNASAMDVEVIIGADGSFHAWDYINYDAGYWGLLDVVNQSVDGTVSAQMWNVTQTFPDGSDFGPVTMAGTVVATQSLVLDHVGVGDTGTLDVQYVPEVADQAYTLADIAGVWTYDNGSGFSDMVTITETGDMSYAASDNCTATGTISIIDTALNGFSFSYDLQCPPGANAVPNGVRTGVGFVDDFNFPDSWLVMAGSIGDEGTLLSWSRPMPSMAAGGMSKPRTAAAPPRRSHR